jgi:DnaJ-class molecular chaperone
MNESDKIQLFDTFKTYFSTYKSFNTYYDSFINLFYDGNETDLKNDFNQFNFNHIYDNIIKKINNIDVINNLNIEYTINVSLEDKYNDIYKRITIPRKTKPDFIADIRILENQIILEKEGELYGSLIINIICDLPDNIQISNNDIFVSKEITLYEYLYGGSFDYIHLNNDHINIQFDSLINKAPISLIKNKGLIHLDDDSTRGDLIIHYHIKNINNNDFKQNISLL